MMRDSGRFEPPFGSERRGQARLPVRGFAVVQGRRGQAQAVDISASGVCLSLSYPLKVGETYRLDLEIHGEPPRVRSVLARVCFCLASNGTYRIGFNCALADFVD
ncbi:MAG TPA: PilZ domain-containing protein [Povalibacter sp.]|uniref:PilZ domain-containing protein n=1 Tax=Povalibacter sp. TaxID=1962978 RepID=UPI002C40C1DE|nr:PilZ domain-containing protein [Povalibacter sp.]HMN43752.1 PilZ domain-containing protein [Povalibacter sp.]